MREENLETEILILKSGLKKYEIAEELGLDQSNFSKWLRLPLTDEKKKKIEVAIKTLKKRK